MESAGVFRGAEAHERFCANADCQGCDFCAAQGPHAWYKSSQWVTLWAEHARQLLATDATPPEWKATLPVGLGMGAPDEFFTVNVLSGSNLPFRKRGLVYVVGFLTSGDAISRP